MTSIVKILPIVLLLAFVKPATAQISDVRMYAFGHSLIDHATGKTETTIMHWVNDIAKEANHTFATGGQYGFLTSHDNLPPSPNWGYDGISGVWTDSEPFSDANVNTILITAANFIQYVAPNQPHPLDTTTTVLKSTQTIFDWVNLQEDDVRYYIYGNWPEMDLQNAFPPTPPSKKEITDFHNLTIGTFNDWWIQYQDSMLISRPALNTRLLPVGMIISKILRDVISDKIPFDQLYEDSAPHGKASIYFLAGMVTYMGVYGQNIPNTYLPASDVDSAIINNMATIRNFAWAELNAFNLPGGQSRVFNKTLGMVKEETDSYKISIFPNPAQGKLTIEGLSKGIYQIDIVDIAGRIVLSKTIESSETLDISKLAVGSYYLKINSAVGSQLYTYKWHKIE